MSLEVELLGQSGSQVLLTYPSLQLGQGIPTSVPADPNSSSPPLLMLLEQNVT